MYMTDKVILEIANVMRELAGHVIKLMIQHWKQGSLQGNCYVLNEPY